LGEREAASGERDVRSPLDITEGIVDRCQHASILEETIARGFTKG